MPDIYLHKDNIGFPEHLVCRCDTGKVQRLLANTPLPDNAILFGSTEFEEICSLLGIDQPVFPSEPYRKALRSVLKDSSASNVPWGVAMPQWAFKRDLKILTDQLINIGNSDLSYFLGTFKETSKIFESLVPACMNPITWKYNSLLGEELVTPHVFATFTPDPSTGLYPETVYSRVATKTGRMTVVEGPNILHLPKTQRNIIGSRYGKEGKILSIDYSSLEPRLAILLSSFLSPLPPLLGYLPQANKLTEIAQQNDIYSFIKTKLGLIDIPRKTVKNIIIDRLYGAGMDLLLEKLEGVRDPRGLISALDEYVGLNGLRDYILQLHLSNGSQYITNYYGRRIDTSQASPYMLINYFVQSTAVDVALYGFTALVKALKHLKRAHPIFILHDALILDVHRSHEEEINAICEPGILGIPKFENSKFPISITSF